MILATEGPEDREKIPIGEMAKKLRGEDGRKNKVLFWPGFTLGLLLFYPCTSSDLFGSYVHWL